MSPLTQLWTWHAHGYTYDTQGKQCDVSGQQRLICAGIPLQKGLCCRDTSMVAANYHTRSADQRDMAHLRGQVASLGMSRGGGGGVRFGHIFLHDWRAGEGG